MDLLIEQLMPSETRMVVESATDGKDTWLNGIFMQAVQRNRNGRVYPITELSRAVETAMGQIKQTNGLFGELDHPNTLTINLDRISHVITEMRMDGNNVYGRAKLLNTPMGQIAKELTRSGVLLGVSSRGAGQVNESGEVSQYQFVTVDIVAQPSAMGAVPSVVYESLQQSANGGRVMTLAEAMQHDPSAQKYFEREIMKWITSLDLARAK